MNILPPGVMNELHARYIAKNSDSVKSIVVTRHKYMFRCSAAESVAIKKYVGVNDSQMRRLGRALFYFTGGLRLLAPANQTAEMKRTWIARNFTTLQHPKIMMRKTTGVGGNKTCMRDIAGESGASSVDY